MNIRKKTISYGDRIYARITQNGRTIYNYVTEKVGSMTEFMMEIRKIMKDVKGLVMIHIRNYNQGWGDERPLMLYGTRQASPERVSQERRMLFPWETH